MKTNFVKAALLAACLLAQAGVQANPMCMAARRAVPATRAIFRMPKRSFYSTVIGVYRDEWKLVRHFNRALVVAALGATSTGYLAYDRYKVNKDNQTMRDEIYGLGHLMDAGEAEREKERAVNSGKLSSETIEKSRESLVCAASRLVSATQKRDPVIQAAKKASEKADQVAAAKKAELEKLTLKS